LRSGRGMKPVSIVLAFAVLTAVLVAAGLLIMRLW
jgi:hypothetical protein